MLYSSAAKKHNKKAIKLTLSIIFILFLSTETYAASIAEVSGYKPKKYTLKISSNTLSASLITIAQQTDLDIIFIPSSKEMDVITPQINGAYDINSALELLLQGSNYDYSWINNAIIIKNTPDLHTLMAPENTHKTNYKEVVSEELFVYGTRQKLIYDNLSSNGTINKNSIELNSITNYNNAAQYIPGFDYIEGNTPTLTIRGVGLEDSSDLSDPLVSTYLNGIYTPRLLSTLPIFYDLQEINISPGPQNNIDSLSSIAGNINIRHARPTPVRELRTSIKFGNYNFKQYALTANSPIIEKEPDKYIVRFSGSHAKRDSFYSNTAESNTKIPGAVDNTVMRLAGRLAISRDWTINAEHSYWKKNGTGNTSISLTSYLQNAFYGDLNNSTLTLNEKKIPRVTDFNLDLPKSIRKSTFLPVDSHEDTTANNTQLTMQYSRGPYLAKFYFAYGAHDSLLVTGHNLGPLYPRSNNISSAGSNIFYEYHNAESLSSYDFTTQANDNQYFSAGAQWKQTFNWANWSTSLNFQSEDTDWFLAESNDRGIGHIGSQYDTRYKSRSIGAFTQGEFALGKTQILTLGFRVKVNKKTREGIGISTAGSGAYQLRHGTEGFLWNINRSTINNPNSYDDPNEKDISGSPIENGSEDDFNVITQREQWEAYSAGVLRWGKEDNAEEHMLASNYLGNRFYIAELSNTLNSAALDWLIQYKKKIKEKTHLDISLSTATSNPGFNDNLNQSSGSTYKAEEAIAFNAGIIHQGKSWTINTNIFYYNYSNKISIVNASPVAYSSIIASKGLNIEHSSNLESSNNFRINIPSARSFGLDIALSKEFSKHWTVNLNALYLNAQYTRGLIPDSRTGVQSDFVNADPLRFNTTQTNTIIPDSSNGLFVFKDDAFEQIATPEKQNKRPGVDANSDGIASNYFRHYCNEGSASIKGDGECYKVVQSTPLIEHPLRDISDNALPRSPKWDVALGVTYSKKWLSSIWQWSTSIKYRSDYFLTPYNSTGFDPIPINLDNNSNHVTYDEAPSFYDKVEAHATANMSLSWKTIGSAPWSILVNIKNLTDTQYFTNISNSAWGYHVQVNDPKTFTVELKKEF